MNYTLYLYLLQLLDYISIIFMYIYILYHFPNSIQKIGKKRLVYTTKMSDTQPLSPKIYVHVKNVWYATVEMLLFSHVKVQMKVPHCHLMLSCMATPMVSEVCISGLSTVTGRWLIKLIHLKRNTRWILIG